MTVSLTDPSAPLVATVHRVEVRVRSDQSDPMGDALLHDARAALGPVTAIHVARVYLIQGTFAPAVATVIADELLADPVTQIASLTPAATEPYHAMIEVHHLPGVMDPAAESTRQAITEMLSDIAPFRGGLPGETADIPPSTSSAPSSRTSGGVEVRTGYRYDLIFDEGTPLPDRDALERFARQTLANPVIEAIHFAPYHPDHFPQAAAYELHLTRVPLRDLDESAMKKLSREGHLFLSIEEMRAIQDYYRAAQREPTDIELETLAQTWSEHCVHKTLKAKIHYQRRPGLAPAGLAPGCRGKPRPTVPGDDVLDFAQRPGHEVHDDGSVTIHNLLKQTIAASTFKLMESEPCKSWCVSVFEDNAGIVRFDDENGVCIKVETHNHPSAIEPYGGAATGIGGCIRDVIGTGLAARPIANTDTFAVAPPTPHDIENVPAGVIHPKRILQRVVAGVRDYGNRMGIPTINGSVYFHEDFLGNPLVFAGCVGLIPLDKCFGQPQPGDRIIALGGATGRDGIHGATFSSSELTDTHASEFSHAVQIGNPITEKKMLDVILQARDFAGGPLFHAITDCGAGGFSSAVGEMGEKVGAFVTLDTAPLKYAGLSYTEIWISEAQERMVLAVPQKNIDALKALCEAEDVTFCDLGYFGHYHEENEPDSRDATHRRENVQKAQETSEPWLTLTYRGTSVGELPMALLHDGLPMPTREAVWPPVGRGLPRHDDREICRGKPRPTSTHAEACSADASIHDMLLSLLSHPNIASKHWIIRQYDHEVQGSSVIKPLVGPHQDGPSDAAVLRPKLDSQRGVAIACGLTPGLSEKSRQTGLASDGDSYFAALAAIDEAVRNVVCVGADPDHIALLDNFCWPGCDDPAQLGALVRAAEACHDGALAYRAPFISGKDSLNNQFTTDDGRIITIPQTLLITAMGIVEDIAFCRTMDAKASGNALLIIGQTTSALGGSHYRMITADGSRNAIIPRVDLAPGPANARALAGLIRDGLVESAHDCSDGGLLVAAAEMAFAGRVGLELELDALPSDRELDAVTACFAETPSRYLLEVKLENLDAIIRRLSATGTLFAQIGRFVEHDRLMVKTARRGRILEAELDNLRQAWLKPLDW